MHLFIPLSILSVTVVAAPKMVVTRNTLNSTPFRFPLPNGFPNISSSSTIKDIEHQAGGPLPDATGGKSTLSPTAARALQAVAFNELFEVAFFTQLLQNVSKSAPGYELDSTHAEVIAALNASQAQEELHLLSANEGLKASGYAQVEPCAYVFPVNSFTQAIQMADDFSSLLIGAISALITQFARGGDDTFPVTTQFCAVLGQEGQQDGYFRSLQMDVPSANPFLTSTTLNFVYNHIKQNYIAQGSCTQSLDVPTFQKLTPLDTPGATDTTVCYSTTQTGVDSSNYIAYMSGQISPVVVAINNITKRTGGLTTFTAAFPFKTKDFSRGLTVAALVKSNSTFMNASDVSLATLAGPALFKVEYQ